MIDLYWRLFKNFVDSKSLYVQYAEDDNIYIIWASDTTTICVCRILKDGGSDQIDFEDNYKPDANTGYTPVSTAIPGTVTSATNNVTSSLTDEQTQELSAVGMGGLLVNVSGTWDGLLYIQGKIGSSDWIDISVQSILTLDGQGVIPIQINGTYTGACIGYTTIRAYAVLNSGTVSIDLGTTSTVTLLTGASAYIFSQSNSRDGSGNPLASSTSTPSGTEQGLIVRNIPSGTQAISGSITASGTVTANAGTNLNTSALALETTQTAQSTLIGAVTETAPASDTASSGLNGRLQRIAQRITSLIALIPLSLGQKTMANAFAVSLASDQSAIPVTIAATQATNIAQMNGVTVTMGNGSSGTGVQRVSIADDSTGLVKLATGANTIGALTANQSVNVAQMNGTTVTMGNGSSGTGVQRVTLSDDSTGLVKLATGANTIGALTANQSVNNAQVAGTTVSTDNGTAGAGCQRVVIASNNTAFSVNATGPTLTKGTQGSTGFSVQNLTDSGRTELRFYAIAVAAGTTTTETAITLTKSSGTSATSSAATFVITSGKRFRITNMSFATRGNATATIQTTTFNFRINTAGAVTTASTPIVLAVRSATPATASAWDRAYVDCGEGWEILGDGTLQFGITAAATYTTNAPTWDVTIVGYEY